MTEQHYNEQRHQLVKDYWFMRSKRCHMSAMARARKIADLDFEYKGTPREITIKKFEYVKQR